MFLNQLFSPRGNITGWLSIADICFNSISKGQDLIKDFSNHNNILSIRIETLILIQDPFEMGNSGLILDQKIPGEGMATHPEFPCLENLMIMSLWK